ncbi:alpha/beta hydrolase [Parasphingorhabdus pacifica]
MSPAFELPPQVKNGAQATALRAMFALPQPVRRAIAGRPIQLDGQELALDAQLLLKMQHLTGKTSLAASTAELARAGMREATALVDAKPIPGISIGNRRIPTSSGELAARLYRPQELTGTSELLVFYHGGGWVIGDLDSHDDLCRFLAKHAGVRVLSVDYRLAPESPFPAGFEDAVDAYRFAVDNAVDLGTRPELVAVGGDSAGGNFAASVAHQAVREGTTTPLFQLLLYPAVDATERRRSRELFSDGFLLTDGDMDWFMDHYVPDPDVRYDPRVSVALSDDLSGLPPAHVVTAGFDPLRDEGETFAELLEKAGVPVVARRFPDLIHGFANLRQAGTRFHEALLEVAGALRAGLSLAAGPRQAADEKPTGRGATAKKAKNGSKSISTKTKRTAKNGSAKQPTASASAAETGSDATAAHADSGSTAPTELTDRG